MHNAEHNKAASKATLCSIICITWQQLSFVLCLYVMEFFFLFLMSLLSSSFFFTVFSQLQAGGVWAGLCSSYLPVFFPCNCRLSAALWLSSCGFRKESCRSWPWNADPVTQIILLCAFKVTARQRTSRKTTREEGKCVPKSQETLQPMRRLSRLVIFL